MNRDTLKAATAAARAFLAAAKVPRHLGNQVDRKTPARLDGSHPRAGRPQETMMGLDCSHDAFHGAYSAFNRLRQAVCAAIGGSFPPHWQDPSNPTSAEVNSDKSPHHFYLPDGFEKEKHPGLVEFLMHSDCDGEIEPRMCERVADELEDIIPDVIALGWAVSGHLSLLGWEGTLRAFIAGCRLAAALNEPLRFR